MERKGYLNNDELDELIRLNGVRPYMAHELSRDVAVYMIGIQNLAATPGADRAVLADWLKPENRPCALRATPAAALVGDNPRAACSNGSPPRSTTSAPGRSTSERPSMTPIASGR